MDKKEIEQIILDALEMANNARDEDDQIPVAPETEIYGSNGHLDSMGLIAFLIDIEESLMDNDIQVTLSDERAMSQSRSPFRNVQSLVTYIDELIKDTK
jgi:acyl carrier protein